MRIAIDATDGMAKELTGTGVYVRNLVRHLLASDGNDEFTLLGLRALASDVELKNTECVRLLWSPPYRSIWAQFRLPVHFIRNRYDLVHFVDHKLPVLGPKRTVVTIHDVAFLKFPGTFRPAHRERLTWFTRDAVRRATRIIAVSESTKADICSYFQTPEEKIDVVHHGVDMDVYRKDVTPAQHPFPYVLSVGALQPRKNYEMLMRAFKRLCPLLPERVDLFIVGPRGWLWDSIEEEARRGQYAERIKLLGYVRDEDMPGLYAGASLVAMPSMYEGFGIPLVEAMACGAPVVAANVSSFPEVVGNAGILLDPYKEDDWVQTLYDLLCSPSRLSDLRKRSIVRSAQFSWTNTAMGTTAVYHRALEM